MIYNHRSYHQCRYALGRRISDYHISNRFGEILRRARIEASLSPEQLSRALFDYCGVHHSARTIYRYESGTHLPSLEFLVAVSLVLDPGIFSNLLTEILSPGLVGRFEMQEAAVHYDDSGQMKLFKE
ncbi:MAG: helix-turn-helix domain-containing protein [Coriobacteriia bacterium]|nr:helix-turn-helix domain-containing protein [Coriobacteriia bacterium]MCL2745879.1 helix-turn-helix domain-containing protein [Coriobacteriia bacterium]MCL2870325.1 helix-turn-helix domain-containing protein [Coriobacteriia bacterium]